MTIKVSAICTNEKTLEELSAAATSLPDIVLSAHNGSVNVLAGVLQKEKPNMVLLDFPTYSEDEIVKVEAALRLSPAVHLVLVSPDRSVEFLLRAMRAGVREVLPSPINIASLQEAIKHARGRQSVASQEKAISQGRVLAVVPSKGGAGATFLATNLAFALSRQGKRVAVLDLNMYFGDAAIFLGDSVAKTTVVDLARKSPDIDRALIESSMVKISDRLHILVAPESPEYINAVTSSAIEKIIELTRGFYDFVVLDISSTLDPLTIKALDMSDAIYLAIQLNLPFVRAAKRMVSVFRELGYPNEKLNVVVNRYEKGGDIALEDVEKATLLKVFRTIPNSHGPVSASINQGIPLLELKPRDEVAVALQTWAQELAPGNAVAAKEEGGWLQGLMRRPK